MEDRVGYKARGALAEEAKRIMQEDEEEN
jgi:TRAF3-interacting protein 1